MRSLLALRLNVVFPFQYAYLRATQVLVLPLVLKRKHLADLCFAPRGPILFSTMDDNAIPPLDPAVRDLLERNGFLPWANLFREQGIVTEILLSKVTEEDLVSFNVPLFAGVKWCK